MGNIQGATTIDFTKHRHGPLHGVTIPLNSGVRTVTIACRKGAQVGETQYSDLVESSDE